MLNSDFDSTIQYGLPFESLFFEAPLNEGGIDFNQMFDPSLSEDVSFEVILSPLLTRAQWNNMQLKFTHSDGSPAFVNRTVLIDPTVSFQDSRKRSTPSVQEFNSHYSTAHGHPPSHSTLPAYAPEAHGHGPGPAGSAPYGVSTGNSPPNRISPGSTPSPADLNANDNINMNVQNNINLRSGHQVHRFPQATHFQYPYPHDHAPFLLPQQGFPAQPPQYLNYYNNHQVHPNDPRMGQNEGYMSANQYPNGPAGPPGPPGPAGPAHKTPVDLYGPYQEMNIPAIGDTQEKTANPLVLSLYGTCSVTGRTLQKCQKCREQDKVTTNRKRKREYDDNWTTTDQENNSKLLQILETGSHKVAEDGVLNLRFRAQCCIGASRQLHRNHLKPGLAPNEGEIHKGCEGLSLVVVVRTYPDNYISANRGQTETEICYVLKEPVRVVGKVAKGAPPVPSTPEQTNNAIQKPQMTPNHPEPKFYMSKINSSTLKGHPPPTPKDNYSRTPNPPMASTPSSSGQQGFTIHIQNPSTPKVGEQNQPNDGFTVTYSKLPEVQPPGPLYTSKTTPLPLPPAPLLNSSIPAPYKMTPSPINTTPTLPLPTNPFAPKPNIQEIDNRHVYELYALYDLTVEEAPPFFHNLMKTFEDTLDATFNLAYRDIFDPNYFSLQNLSRFPYFSYQMLHVYNTIIVVELTMKSGKRKEKMFAISEEISTGVSRLLHQNTLSDKDKVYLADALNRTAIFQIIRGRFAKAKYFANHAHDLFESVSTYDPSLRTTPHYELNMWHLTCLFPEQTTLQQAYEWALPLKRPKIMSRIIFYLIMSVLFAGFHLGPIAAPHKPCPPVPETQKQILLPLLDQLEESINQITPSIVGYSRLDILHNFYNKDPPSVASSSLLCKHTLKALKNFIQWDLAAVEEDIEECAILAPLVCNFKADSIVLNIASMVSIQLVGTYLFTDGNPKTQFSEAEKKKIRRCIHYADTLTKFSKLIFLPFGKFADEFMGTIYKSFLSKALPYINQ